MSLLSVSIGFIQACVFTFENDSRVMVRVVDMDNSAKSFELLPYASTNLGVADGHSNYHIYQKNGPGFSLVYDLKMTGCAMPGEKPHVKFSGLANNNVPGIFTVVIHPRMKEGEIVHKADILKSFQQAADME